MHMECFKFADLLDETATFPFNKPNVSLLCTGVSGDNTIAYEHEPSSKSSVILCSGRT